MCMAKQINYCVHYRQSYKEELMTLVLSLSSVPEIRFLSQTKYQVLVNKSVHSKYVLSNS